MSVCMNVRLCRAVLTVNALPSTAYRPCQSLLQEGPPHCPPPYWGPSWCSSAGRTAGRASLHCTHLLSLPRLQFLAIAQPQSSTKDVRTEQPVGHWMGETFCRLWEAQCSLSIRPSFNCSYLYVELVQCILQIHICTVYVYAEFGPSLWLNTGTCM